MTPAFWRVPSSFLAWQTTVRLECFPLVILLRFPSRVWKTQPDLTVCACRLLVLLLSFVPTAECYLLPALATPHDLPQFIVPPIQVECCLRDAEVAVFSLLSQILTLGRHLSTLSCSPSLFTLRQWTIGQYELMSPWLFKINPTKLLKHYICQRVLIPPPSDYGLGTPPSHCEQPCPRHLMVVGFWSLLLQVIA